MLSQENQIKLIKEYQTNKNEDVLLEILQSNIKLINKLAYMFYKQNKHLSLKDLQSSGYEGLILAVNKFQCDKNTLFFTYVKTWIHAKMREYIMKNTSSLSISGKEGRHLFSNFYKIDKTENNSRAYSSFYNAINPTSSISFSKHDDSESLEEKISTSSYSMELELEKKYAKEKFQTQIQDFSRSLPDIEKCVLFDRLLSEEPKTLSELSSKFNCSDQSIFYTEKKIIEKLKKRILNSKDKELIHSILE